MPSLTRVFQQAVRRLSRARTFALAAILTFAFGIGGATAVFTVVNGVLLRPLPYRRADQLVDLSHTLQVSGLLRVDQSDATYLGYRRHNRVFTDVGAYRSTAANLARRSGPGDRAESSPTRVSAALATGSLFHVLDVRSQKGRTLTDDDGTPGAPAVAVVGQHLWQREFGADPAIVGQHIIVDGVDREIVGVMPASFRFPDPETALWLPLRLDPSHVASAAFDYHAVARLRDGISPAAAVVDLQRVLPTVPEEFPGRLTAASIPAVHMQAVVRPLRDVVVGDAGHVLWIVLGAVGVLLLIACANVANLFVARAEGRQRELAVRRALGASQGTMLVEFLSEGALLLAVGAALGAAIAAAGVGALKSMQVGASIPRLSEVHVDAVALAVVAGVTALSALLVSAVSAMRACTSSLSAVLMGGGRSATTGRARLRGRRALVVAQVALALMLLIAAGLLGRSFMRLRRVDPGFVASHALTLRVTLPEVTYPTAADAARLIVRGLSAISSLPGVQAVGVSTKLPLSEQGRQDSAVFIEDHPVAGTSMGGGLPDLHQIIFVTPGYFRAMGIPLTAGRLSAPPDAAGAPSPGPAEVLVSAAFARRYWSGTQAVGKRIKMNPTDPWSTIVGIVGDVHDVALDQPPSAIVYPALVTMSAAGTPWTPHSVAFAVRTSGDPVSVTTPVERAVGALDPALPLYGVTPLSTLLSEASARTSFTLLVLAIAAMVALGIGAVGIYGVIAYLVSLRTREIGVRLALGAHPANVRRMVTRQALADAAVGIALGLAGAVAATRLMTAVLFEMSPIDPVTFGLAACALLLTAVAASWLPARRAAALDPATALRGE
jgi:putative ABC transport system permease protein